MCPPTKESYSAFLQAGRVRVKKISNTKAYSVSHSDSKTRGVFFHSTWPSSHNTQAQKHTVAHQHTHSLLSLNSCGNISGFFWLCFQYRLAMHLHTDTVSLSFSVSFVSVTVAGCGNSAAPTGGGLMGLLLLKPLILGAVMVCRAVLTFCSLSC